MMGTKKTRLLVSPVTLASTSQQHGFKQIKNTEFQNTTVLEVPESLPCFSAGKGNYLHRREALRTNDGEKV